MKGINKLILVSFLSLTTSIVIWPELFLFSKVVHLPKWATYLPCFFMGAHLLTLICLLPLLFLSKPIKSLLIIIFIVLTVSSILGVNLALYLAHGTYTINNYIYNYISQTVWLFTVIFLLPSLVIVVINALIGKGKYNYG